MVHTRISHEADIEVAADLHPILHLLSHSANKKQQKSFLHILQQAIPMNEIVTMTGVR